MILFFTELFQDLRQMQEAWLAEGISLTFYRADISIKKKLQYFDTLYVIIAVKKHVMYLGLIQTFLNMQCLSQRSKIARYYRNKLV